MSEAKTKGGIFVGIQIRKLFKNSEFDAAHEGDYKDPRDPFKMVVRRFLNNKRVENYAAIANNLLKSLRWDVT